jgi:hypothetical protein
MARRVPWSGLTAQAVLIGLAAVDMDDRHQAGRGLDDLARTRNRRRFSRPTPETIIAPAGLGAAGTVRELLALPGHRRADCRRTP